MSTQTKLCPHCKQEIPADSLKCHYCREWVSRGHAVKRALVWVVPMVAFWIGLVLFMENADRTMLREERFWQKPDAIKVLNHHAGESEEGRLCVIGTMKNVSAIPWRFVTAQVDYYDSQDKLVDTSQDSMTETLPPGQERSFKVVF